jgi:hypothetical protein
MLGTSSCSDWRILWGFASSCKCRHVFTSFFTNDPTIRRGVVWGTTSVVKQNMRLHGMFINTFVLSSALWHCVVCKVDTMISVEYTASIFRVKACQSFTFMSHISIFLQFPYNKNFPFHLFLKSATYFVPCLTDHLSFCLDDMNRIPECYWLKQYWLVWTNNETTLFQNEAYTFLHCDMWPF